MNRSPSHSRLLSLLAAAALASAVAGAAEAPVAARPVNVVTARRAPGASELVLPASLLANQEAALYARTTGYLARWNVDLGDAVKAGQVLAVIDSPEVDQQLNQAKAALALAQANAALAKATAARWQEMAEKNVVSRQEVEEKSAAAQAGAASVRAAEAEVGRLTQLQGFEQVTAPFDGVVAARPTDAGALITTDASRLMLFRLTQRDPLRVTVGIPQTYVRSIRAGLPAEILVNEYPHRAFPGKVSRVAGALDPVSRTLQAEIQIPNSQGELLPGMFAQVRLLLVPVDPPLLVPANAAIIRADGNLVAVVEPGNRIRLKPVKFGRDYGTQIEIVDGLAEGAVLVSNPSDALTDGALVEPLSPEKK